MDLAAIILASAALVLSLACLCLSLKAGRDGLRRVKRLRSDVKGLRADLTKVDSALDGLMELLEAPPRMQGDRDPVWSKMTKGPTSNGEMK